MLLLPSLQMHIDAQFILLSSFMSAYAVMLMCRVGSSPHGGNQGDRVQAEASLSPLCWWPPPPLALLQRKQPSSLYIWPWSQPWCWWEEKGRRHNTGSISTSSVMPQIFFTKEKIRNWKKKCILLTPAAFYGRALLVHATERYRTLLGKKMW